MYRFCAALKIESELRFKVDEKKIFLLFAREGAQAQPIVRRDSQNVMAIIENHYLIKCRLTKQLRDEERTLGPT